MEGHLQVCLPITVFQPVIQPGYSEKPAIGLHLRNPFQFRAQGIRKELVQAGRPVHFDDTIRVICAAVPLVDAYRAIV